MDFPTVTFKDENTSLLAGIEVLQLDDLYRLKTLDHDPGRPHKLGFHCFIYISEGQGSHLIDFYPHEVAGGCCISVNKHQIQAYDFVNKPRGKLLLFTDEFIEGVRSHMRTSVFTHAHLAIGYSPVLPLDASAQRTCAALLDEIEQAIANPDADQLFTQLLFSALMRHIELNQKQADCQRQAISEAKMHKFSAFLELLSRHYCQTRDAEDYAKMLYMSYKSLNQLCKLVSKQTAKQQIDAFVILQAKRKLAIEKLQVQELAFELGFEDLSNFVKYFKKHTSMTPAKFRLQ